MEENYEHFEVRRNRNKNWRVSLQYSDSRNRRKKKKKQVEDIQRVNKQQNILELKSLKSIYSKAIKGKPDDR